MIELAWVPFVVLLLVFCAFVAENWPRHDPMDDAAYDRRHHAHEARRWQAHVRERVR